MNYFETLKDTVSPGAPESIQKVVVNLDGEMWEKFAVSYLSELRFANHNLFRKVQLGEEELKQYFSFLFSRRVEVVNDTCLDFRRLKQLWVPAFIQHVMNMVGSVVVRKYGLEFSPSYDGEVIGLEDALAISEKVGRFAEILPMNQNAFSTDKTGNLDVMTSAIIREHVMSREPLSDGLAVYLTAFLGLRLAQEETFQVLYRIQYDDVTLLQSELMRNKALYR